MPLLELDAVTAWENIYSNFPMQFWPGGNGRFEPFASPDCHPSFKLSPGERIFTIGSCFARNIEEHLQSQGFDVITRRHGGMAHRLNKYNCFSMMEDIKYVLGKRRLTPEQRFIQIDADGWMDMQSHHTVKQSWDECIQDMNRSIAMYENVIDCPYFVITMGLAEVWFDRETQTYLNEITNFVKYHKENPKMRDLFIKRFVFRVLSYEECYQSARELISLIREASPRCKVILTVSPVPLGATFTGKEIMSANMYSKSVLRCAAEQICAENEGVDYFPSYESVMLSPRAVTWETDNIHVKDEAVKYNIKKMVEKYIL